MKEAESSFDVSASVKELQTFVGGRIDQVYHPTPDHLVLAVRLPGEGKAYIHFIAGRWLYGTDTSGEMPLQPSDFAMMLRKRIANAKIVGIRQQGFDRISVMSLEKDEKFELVLELFGDGNVILVKDGIIVQPLTSHTWKHRDVRAKKPFSFPPPIPDPSPMTTDDLLRILRASDTDLVRTLATRLNLGGRYAEEICARAGVTKNAESKNVSDTAAQTILSSIKSFLEELRASTGGFVVLENGVVEDVVPIMLRTQSGLEHERYDTFSEAIASYIGRAPKPKKAEPKEEQLELDRLRRKLAQQELALTSLQDESRESQMLGDFVFASYGEIAKAISAAKERLLEGRDLSDIPGFVSLDRKNSTLKVIIGATQVSLDLRGSVESSARQYYEKSKRSRRKIEGVLAAIDQAKKDLDNLLRTQRKTEASTRKKPAPTKHFWFERYRWFVSSEGAIVLGGKDAKSNDMLVKKHLEAGDRYVHADIHGAPSLVVKMKEGVTEQTLREACVFAVATSKAWNAKIGSVAGYWVLPEQVSKTPQSGEYLAKGAFVIRGKRNYSEKLELKLGIGEILFEGSKKIMCAPEASIRKHSTRYLMIRPGGQDRNELAKKLSDSFEVPIEEIQSVLPPGDVEVVEQVGLTVS